MRPGERVASPGTSPHEAGFSLDIQWRGLTADEQELLLGAAYGSGWDQPYPGDDPVHFSPGTYGPYGGRQAAIRHNAPLLEAGGPGGQNLTQCKVTAQKQDIERTHDQ